MTFSARRISPASVLALIALFFAVSGQVSAESSTSTGLKPVTGISVSTVKSGGGMIMPGMVDTGIAHCPSGYFVLSGGWEYQDSITITTDLSGPAANNTAWEVEASNPPLGQAGHAYAVAYCGKFSH